MRGRERLAGREALPASCGLERVVVGVGALALLGGNPTQEYPFRRGVVDAARVHGSQQIADAVVELLSLPFAVARADAMGDHVGVGVVAERLFDGRVLSLSVVGNVGKLPLTAPDLAAAL